MKGLFQCPPRVTPWVKHTTNKTPCKGKNFVFESFCPYRATSLYPHYTQGAALG